MARPSFLKCHFILYLFTTLIRDCWNNQKLFLLKKKIKKVFLILLLYQSGIRNAYTTSMFGELVCGPPGSGKTTYCEGKRQFLAVRDPSRPTVILNLDPANEDNFPYPCDVDVRDVVCHENVMEGESLGPNGSYLFCATILENHLDWIINEISCAVQRRTAEIAAALVAPPSSSESGPSSFLQGSSSGRSPGPPYLIVDCPGQVEFYLHSSFMHSFLKSLQKRLRATVCTIHLVDAGIATRDVPTYVAACLLAVTTMIEHEQPHLNVLTKWDTVVPEDVENPFTGDWSDSPFFNPSELSGNSLEGLWRRQIQRRRRDLRAAQYHVTGKEPTPLLDDEDKECDAALMHVDLAKHAGRIYHYTTALLEVVNDYNLLNFAPLSVESQELMLSLTQKIDNAIGLFR